MAFERKKIACATPIHRRGDLRPQLTDSLRRVWDFTAHEMVKESDSPSPLLLGFGTAIHRTRARLVNKARELNADYIFFVDSDMGDFAPDIIDRFVAHKVDIVSALMVMTPSEEQPMDLVHVIRDMSGFPHPLVLKPEHIAHGGLMPVDGTGMACTLIDMKVFDEVASPWFDWKREGHQLCGHDYGLCFRAKAKGFEIYVDASVIVKHYDMYGYTVWDYFKERQATEQPMIWHGKAKQLYMTEDDVKREEAEMVPQSDSIGAA